jgi:hypothetical protein
MHQARMITSQVAEHVRPNPVIMCVKLNGLLTFRMRKFFFGNPVPPLEVRQIPMLNWEIYGSTTVTVRYDGYSESKDTNPVKMQGHSPPQKWQCCRVI